MSIFQILVILNEKNVKTIVLGILFKNGDFYKLKITWYKVKK